MTSTTRTLFNPSELRDRILAKLNVESKDLSTNSRGCLNLFMDVLDAPAELQTTINLLLEDHKKGLANSPVVPPRSSQFEDMAIMQPPLFVEATAPNMPAVQSMKMTTATIGGPPSVTKAEMEKLAPFMKAMLDSATWFSNVDQDTTVTPELSVPEQKYPLQEVKVAASAADPPGAALSESSLPSKNIRQCLEEEFKVSLKDRTKLIEAELTRLINAPPDDAKSDSLTASYSVIAATLAADKITKMMESRNLKTLTPAQFKDFLFSVQGEWLNNKTITQQQFRQMSLAMTKNVPPEIVAYRCFWVQCWHCNQPTLVHEQYALFANGTDKFSLPMWKKMCAHEFYASGHMTVEQFEKDQFELFVNSEEHLCSPNGLPPRRVRLLSRAEDLNSLPNHHMILIIVKHPTSIVTFDPTGGGGGGNDGMLAVLHHPVVESITRSESLQKDSKFQLGLHTYCVMHASKPVLTAPPTGKVDWFKSDYASHFTVCDREGDVEDQLYYFLGFHYGPGSPFVYLHCPHKPAGLASTNADGTTSVIKIINSKQSLPSKELPESKLDIMDYKEVETFFKDELCANGPAEQEFLKEQGSSVAPSVGKNHKKNKKKKDKQKQKVSKVDEQLAEVKQAAGAVIATWIEGASPVLATLCVNPKQVDVPVHVDPDPVFTKALTAVRAAQFCSGPIKFLHLTELQRFVKKGDFASVFKDVRRHLLTVPNPFGFARQFGEILDHMDTAAKLKIDAMDRRLRTEYESARLLCETYPRLDLWIVKWSDVRSWLVKPTNDTTRVCKGTTGFCVLDLALRMFHRIKPSSFAALWQFPPKDNKSRSSAPTKSKSSLSLPEESDPSADEKRVSPNSQPIVEPEKPSNDQKRISDKPLADSQLSQVVTAVRAAQFFAPASKVHDEIDKQMKLLETAELDQLPELLDQSNRQLKECMAPFYFCKRLHAVVTARSGRNPNENPATLMQLSMVEQAILLCRTYPRLEWWSTAWEEIMSWLLKPSAEPCLLERGLQLFQREDPLQFAKVWQPTPDDLPLDTEGKFVDASMSWGDPLTHQDTPSDDSADQKISQFLQDTRAMAIQNHMLMDQLKDADLRHKELLNEHVAEQKESARLLAQEEKAREDACHKLTGQIREGEKRIKDIVAKNDANSKQQKNQLESLRQSFVEVSNEKTQIVERLRKLESELLNKQKEVDQHLNDSLANHNRYVEADLKLQVALAANTELKTRLDRAVNITKMTTPDIVDLQERLATERQQRAEMVVQMRLAELDKRTAELDKREAKAQEAKICPVCLEPCADHILPCGHNMCKPCAPGILPRNSNMKPCPVCRKVFDCTLITKAFALAG